ncbi:MAG: hypothetical protein JNM10_04715 [Planctomycetia bacterium]|nr:hypothetical protein [Planctomycetia bacterium]
MPLLLRVAHVGEIPSGTSRVVKVRGEKVRVARVGDTWAAFPAADAPMADVVGEADLAWARQNAARGYRVVVRGTYVHVAVDAAPESAPAAIQANARTPELTPRG